MMLLEGDAYSAMSLNPTPLMVFSSTPGSSSSAVRIFLMNTSKLLEAK